MPVREGRMRYGIAYASQLLRRRIGGPLLRADAGPPGQRAWIVRGQCEHFVEQPSRLHATSAEGALVGMTSTQVQVDGLRVGRGCSGQNGAHFQRSAGDPV
jgi:hypothetical protein